MSNISLRHVPDISDTTASGSFDFSDSSFQIPAAANDSVDLLMAQDGGDFFHGEDPTINTPAVPRIQRAVAPLTLAELTPRHTKHERFAAPVRSSLRPRPQIATPRRPAVTKDLVAALSEGLPGSVGSDASFEIPLGQTGPSDLIIGDNGTDFVAAGEDDLSNGQLSPATTQPLSVSKVTTSQTPRRMPSASRAVGNDPRAASPSPSSTDVRPPPHVAAPHQGPSSLDIETQPATQRPLSTDTLDQLKADVATLTAPEQQQHHEVTLEIAPKIPSCKSSAALDSGKDVPGAVNAKRKRAVVDGGTSKSGRVKLPTSTLTKTTEKSVGIRQRPPTMSAATLDVASVSAHAKNSHQNVPNLGNGAPEYRAGGLAEALLSFGQKLAQVPTRSERLGGHIDDQNSDSARAGSTQCQVAEGRSTPGSPSNDPSPSSDSVTPLADPDADADNDRPFTLSQLSPRKQSETPKLALNTSLGHTKDKWTLDSDVPPSPMRPSAKRPPPSTAPADTLMGHKPSKKMRGAVEREQPTSNVIGGHTLRPSRARNALAPGLGSNSRSRLESRRTAADRSLKRSRDTGKARASSGLVVATRSVGAKENTLSESAAAPSGSRVAGRSRGTRRPQREKVPEPEAAGRRFAQTHTEGHMPKAGQTSSSSERPVASLPPAKPTRPIEFHFQTDTRLETRKAELDKSNSSSLRLSRSRSRLAIPDFKAMHAAHESLMASRREHIVPVVPMDVALHTEMRAQEREKFEEERRNREREMEAQMEERRRARELEEEREIRELRKRAVPKANEVPEWYAHAPKKGEKTRV